MAPAVGIDLLFIYYLNTIFKGRALVFLCTESVPDLCTDIERCG